MKTHPWFCSLFSVFIAAVFLNAAAVVSLASSSSALIAEINGLSSLDQKIQFITTHPLGDGAAKAGIAAAMIEAAPANSRQETATRVLEALVGMNPHPQDSAKFAALVAKDLPKDVAATVASAIIIGAGKSDPAHFPKITAQVILSQSSTVYNAAAIAREVVAASPVSRASDIAVAIGTAFSSNQRLADEVPEIAAAFAQALVEKVHKGAPVPEVRSALADSVAALVVLIPGSVRQNHDLIIKVGKEVAAVVGPAQPGMATTIVGVTSAALKSSSGTSDITSALNDFSNEFKDVIADPVIQSKLDSVVSDINTGASSKEVKPLENPSPENTDPTPYNPPVGPIINPESNTLNH